MLLLMTFGGRAEALSVLYLLWIFPSLGYPFGIRKGQITPTDSFQNPWPSFSPKPFLILPPMPVSCLPGFANQSHSRLCNRILIHRTGQGDNIAACRHASETQEHGCATCLTYLGWQS